jgi:spoIIIJ-associated protein
VDERRHNMDGALFVDEERTERAPDRDRDRAARPRRAYDDGKAEAARRVTQGILDRMDLEASVEIRDDDERIVLDIDGPDAGRAIGKKGMTLEALQFLVNKIVNRDPDERRHVVLDSGDYRERHDNGLVSMAKRAITSGRPVTLEPMSARDRRVIHVSLAKFPGVSTRSEGEGMDRRLQIIPARDRGGRDERSRGRERDDRDRSSDARPARPRSDDRDRPARPRSDDRDRPRSDAPRDDRDRPRSDAPRDDRDRPRSDAPRDDRDRPRSDAPRDDRAPEGEPRRERSVGPRFDDERLPERERDYEQPRHDDRDAPRTYDRAPSDRGRGR